MNASQPQPSDFIPLGSKQPDDCGGCGNPERLGFQFDDAYQPIVDVATRRVYAHEALVRGPQGEGAMSVLAQVNEVNRYRFDQACRVKAIKTAAQLGLAQRVSINFLPNAVYKRDADAGLSVRPSGVPRADAGERHPLGMSLCPSHSTAADRKRRQAHTTRKPGDQMRKLRCLAGLMTAALVAGCSPGQDVSGRIAAEAAKAQTIDLAALTPFAWDHALVFGPYTSKQRICAALPTSSPPCATADPDGVGEGSYLMAFLRAGQVVHHELHARRNGEFCSDSCVLELRPETARFTVGASPSAADRKRFSPAAR